MIFRKYQYYSVYIPVDGTAEISESAVFVRNGVDVFNLIPYYTVGWLLVKKMWFYSLLFVILLMTGLALYQELPLLSGTSIFMLSLFMVLNSNDIYCYFLEKRGYCLYEVVVAEDLIKAKRKVFRSYYA